MSTKPPTCNGATASRLSAKALLRTQRRHARPRHQQSGQNYEHIDPALVGNERRILVSELSGAATSLAVATKHNIADDRELMPTRFWPKWCGWKTKGYQFENAGASFDLLVKRVAGTFTSHFKPIKYRIVAVIATVSTRRCLPKRSSS